MRLFLDTNIMLDHILGRQPFADDAEKLMLLLSLNELEGWCGVSQYTDLFYVLTHGAGKVAPDAAKDSIRLMRTAVHGCSLSDEDAENALDSTWADFEDACIYQMALKVEADALITRDKEGFALSSIPVFDCVQLFVWLREKKGLDYDEITLEAN